MENIITFENYKQPDTLSWYSNQTNTIIYITSDAPTGFAGAHLSEAKNMLNKMGFIYNKYKNVYQRNVPINWLDETGKISTNIQKDLENKLSAINTSITYQKPSNLYLGKDSDINYKTNPNTNLATNRFSKDIFEEPTRITKIEQPKTPFIPTNERLLKPGDTIEVNQLIPGTTTRKRGTILSIEKGIATIDFTKQGGTIQRYAINRGNIAKIN